MRRTMSLVLVLFLAAAGCSRTILVTIPPRIDLSAHNDIGIIEFTGGSAATMGRRTTQEFIQTVQSAQPPR